jgi:hypothetical protein
MSGCAITLEIENERSGKPLNNEDIDIIKVVRHSQKKNAI